MEQDTLEISKSYMDENQSVILYGQIGKHNDVKKRKMLNMFKALPVL